MMKIALAFSLAALAAAPLAFAETDKHDHGATHAARAQSHHAAGVVKSIDADKGTLTIAHGPVASLNWPGMTMAFRAKDRQLLGSVKPGQKIDFDFVQEGKAYVVIRAK